MKFEQFYALLDAVRTVTEGGEDHSSLSLVSSLYATIIGCYSLSYTPAQHNFHQQTLPCHATTKTHILNAALSRQINRFYLSEELPTNVISFVIVVCDKLGDIVVSLSRGVEPTILKYRDIESSVGRASYGVVREILHIYLFR